MAAACSTLRKVREGTVLFVTLDNPPVNLMDRSMIRDLRGLLDELQNDDDIRAVVFRSASREFFVSHADLSFFAAHAPETPPPRPSTLNALNAMFEGYRSLGKATIAVLEGRSNGAGTEFALSLDMRFAERRAAFLGQFEVALGCLPGGTGTQRMPALAGRARALELILGCDEVDADTAQRYGLVNRALEPGELWPFVRRLASRIGSFPLEAIRLAKQAVDSGLPDPLPGLLEESDLAGRLMATAEAKRRFRAILARGAQTPEFERDLAQRLPGLADPD